MARDEDEDPDDALPPIGEGTVGFLEQAKKGKPRNFLLICKGPKIKYLLVKKKPIKKAEITEAKKLGYKGDAFIGVITGGGMQLVFNLAISDGYDSEPCTEKKLKDFLGEHAEMKLQPSFAIVAAPPEVPFDEDELNHPLVAQFQKLEEFSKQVLAKRPECTGELESSAKEIRLLLQDASFPAAQQRIGQYETRLRELDSGATSHATPTAPEGNESTQIDESLRRKLTDTLNKLAPQIKQAVTSFPDRKAELLSPVAEIKRQIESGDLQTARESILSLGKNLQRLLAGNSSPTVESNQSDQLKSSFEQKFAQLDPLYQQALRQQLGDTSKFRAVMAYATENAEAGNYANALKAIERLMQAVEQAIATATEQKQASTENQSNQSQSNQSQRKYTPKMAFQRARLEWAMACDSVNQQIRQLKEAILQASDELGPDGLVTIDSSTDQLYSILGDLARELQNRFDENIGELESADQQSAVEGAIKVMDNYITFVDKNPLTDAAENNPFGVRVAVRDSLAGKLTDLKTEFLRSIA